MSRRILEGIGGVLWGVVILAVNVVIASASLGVVKEHCLDVEASEAIQQVQVDSHWTYIVWPPLPFAAVDPPGRCVRNTPLREGLNAAGVWTLPSADEQVRRHVTDQLEDDRP